MNNVVVFDPTIADKKSAVRGVGRYLQILKENFTEWSFTNDLSMIKKQATVFINPFFNFLQPPLTLKKIASRQIAVIHDLIPLKYPDYFPTGFKGKVNIFLNKIALKNYDLIITDSFASQKDIASLLKIPKEKIKVIYPCLSRVFKEVQSQDGVLKAKKPSNIEKYCLYVGDGTWNKNLVNLAKAIKIANVSCVFVGKVFDIKNANLNHHWQKELKDFFTITKNDKRFIFAGYVPDKELVSFYQTASLNILVSHDEGFGFSYLEASFFNCPSVVSQINVLKEISEGQGVLFADDNNPNDIADKIGEIYFNNNLRERLGREAKKRIDFFSQEKFRQQFLEIIS